MLFGLIKTNKDKKIESLEKEVETLEKEVTELKLQSSMESPFKVSVNTGKVVTLKKSVLLLLDEPYDMVEEEIARGFTPDAIKSFIRYEVTDDIYSSKKRLTGTLSLIQVD